MEEVQYFGYGANKDPRMMEAITGNPNLAGAPAELSDWELCVQRLDQIPDALDPESGFPISPRDAIRKDWGDEFETYVIRPAEGKIVKGTLWRLTPQERELVRNWELVGPWYREVEVDVKTSEGVVSVQTEVLGLGQEIDRTVDGTDYEPFLLDPDDFVRIAEHDREEFFSDLNEGKRKLTEKE